MAALDPDIVWEVRTTGDAANGGAFRAGATGTDYSQQDAAQVSYTDLAVDASNNLKVTSAANPFTASHVGNVIKISSASPWTAGYYEVVSVASAAATLNASPAAASSTGGVGKLGGASDSLATVAGAIVASNVVWIKQGTYSLAAGITLTASVTPLASAPRTRIAGYGTTRGDGGRPKLLATAVYQAVIAGTSINGFSFENLEIDGGGVAVYGIQISGSYHRVWNCKVSNLTYAGVYFQSKSVIESCEATTSGTGYGFNADYVLNSHAHDNAGTGIVSTNGAVVSCVSANNTGSTSDGIQVGASVNNSIVLNCTCHGNGRHGIYSNSLVGVIAHSNILASNGGYGILFAPSAGFRASPMTDGNVYYNNTSGTRSNGDDTTVNPQNASGAYTNARDKTLTVNPFVDAANDDFRLNATAGGGAECRGTGEPSNWPGLSIAGYPDMGAVQHQDSGGGSSGGGGVIGSPIIKSTRRHS